MSASMRQDSKTNSVVLNTALKYKISRNTKTNKHTTTHKHTAPARPLQTRTQTGPITIHCVAKLSAQCNQRGCEKLYTTSEKIRKSWRWTFRAHKVIVKYLFVYLFIYYCLPEITLRQSHVSKHEAGQ